MGTAGVMSAVTTPAPLGGNMPAVTDALILFALHTCVCVKGQEPPQVQSAEMGRPSFKEPGLEVPGPQCCSCSKWMDAALPAPRGLCLKFIWVFLIVSQLQHGSPQSCWKERSCWHYEWYLFRAAHCAWQRLPGGGEACDECKTTYADGFSSWKCVQLYKIHGESQILLTYVVPNTSKLVWKRQLIIFMYYYSQKAQCKYTCTHIKVLLGKHV